MSDDDDDFARRREEVLDQVRQLIGELAQTLGAGMIHEGRDGRSWFVVRREGQVALTVKVGFGGTWSDLRDREISELEGKGRV